MRKIKVRTPAKINLTLEVINRRDDGFHNIQSIMQAVNLYDYLTFELSESSGTVIELNGNSKEIPYDSSNLIYKAAIKFLEKTKINNIKLRINIEKNIPAAAGLAGGSSNAAGTFFALNKLFDNILSNNELDKLCTLLGSDLNFCFKGGCALCTSRGEITEKLPFYEQNISLIKPKDFGISAKEAYTKFALLKDKSYPDNTSKLKYLLSEGKFDKTLIYNSLEKALLPDYTELRTIKNRVKNSLMSGSGSTFFVLDSKLETDLDKSNYYIRENLKTINTGVEEIND